jgi:nascent polypeptide-associated complex subunit beta
MSGVKVGTQTGQKGSFRRKAKKASKSPNQEGNKVWLAANHLGLREISALDSASFIIQGAEDAIYLAKPEALVDLRNNTFVLRGKPEPKKVAEVLQDLLRGMDLGKLGKGDAATPEDSAEAGDLGDVPADIDFAQPDGGEDKAVD